MHDALADAQVFRTAARLNEADPLRQGSLLCFPDYGQVVMTGDLHGHRRNLERLQKFALLERSPTRHVMLHELIHEEPIHLLAEDMSHQVALEAARWKTAFPDQIHFLQSNHELSQLTGKEICKGGRVVTYDFERSLSATYGAGAQHLLEALCEFIASFPLAARTTNRVLLSHSLPNVRDLAVFDPTVVHRALGDEDLREGGHAYLMVWGRHHTPQLLETLAAAFDVDWFLCGHQPQEDGFQIVHERMIVLASDHNHGVFLPFDLKKRYTLDDLTRLIRPLCGIE